MTLFTVGHGTHSQDSLAALLKGAGIERVVDVRRFPGSRRHPQFSQGALGQWLPQAGVGYRWEPALGGFRKVPPESPDVALRNVSFRGYAAHMRTDEFRRAMDSLLGEARERPVAVMCSESVWWRCHRRLVADHAALVQGVGVAHLMPDGSLAEHVPTAGARLEGDQLFYDGGHRPLGGP